MANGEARDLKQRLAEFNSNYEKGKPEWFEHFADDATIYTIGSTEPFRGRAAYEKNFKSLLTQEKRKVNVLKEDVQVMGDTAVTMELQEVTQSKVTSVFRQSTIWKQEHGDWKIIHMHSSSVGIATPTEVPRDPQSIRVLAEKLAVTSAQVGVAQ